jgi:hypothetical protein
MAYIEVDIDVDDFYSELSSREKRELINLLESDGLLPDTGDADDTELVGSPMDHEWDEMLTKINNGRYQLTSEQEQLLITLAKNL